MGNNRSDGTVLYNALSCERKKDLFGIMVQCINNDDKYEKIIISSELVFGIREKLGDRLTNIIQEIRPQWIKDEQIINEDKLKTYINGMLGTLIKDRAAYMGYRQAFSKKCDRNKFDTYNVYEPIYHNIEL